MTTDRDHMFDGDQELDEQESRIRELKRQAEDPSGGEMLSVDFAGAGASPPLTPRPTPAAPEPFWATVQHAGAAAWTSEFEQLQRQGVALPPPEQLDDADVARKVAEIADAMSRRNVFLEHTDHLSDRALYEQLYRETLHEAPQDLPAGAEDGGDAFVKYDLGGAGAGAGAGGRTPRPFDRDRHLPQPGEGPLIDDELPIDERWLGDDTVR